MTQGQGSGEGTEAYLPNSEDGFVTVRFEFHVKWILLEWSGLFLAPPVPTSWTSQYSWLQKVTANAAVTRRHKRHV